MTGGDPGPGVGAGQTYSPGDTLGMEAGGPGGRGGLQNPSPLKMEAQGSQKIPSTACGNAEASLKRLTILQGPIWTSVPARTERSLSPLAEEMQGAGEVLGWKRACVCVCACVHVLAPWDCWIKNTDVMKTLKEFFLPSKRNSVLWLDIVPGRQNKCC